MKSITLKAFLCLFLAIGLIGWDNPGFAAGSYNTATGLNALPNSSGSYNTADGYAALYKNATGSGNTASGADALNQNTTGNNNTASGVSALQSNTTGKGNTASGSDALFHNTTGNTNTASGVSALQSNTIGINNTASGADALFHNTTGINNAASGHSALQSNTTGNNNTASGAGALLSNTTGKRNTALGFLAGNYSTDFTGYGDIYIGANVGPLSAAESDTIRIGSGQSATFIAGIAGHGDGGSAVYVDPKTGQLGTITSSRRYKDDIEDMGDVSSGLMKLRPVTFYYKPEYGNGPRSLQYGLIAEEVAEVYPGLVQYDPKTGQPQSVYYHLVNAMLLNEVQKQQHRFAEQEQRIISLEEQNKELSALKEQVRELSALNDQVRELSALIEQNKDSSGRLSKLEARLDR